MYTNQFFIPYLYGKVVINSIKIQRCWKKYKYGTRKNIIKIFLQRELVGKNILQNYIKKRTPAWDNNYETFKELKIVFKT